MLGDEKMSDDNRKEINERIKQQLEKSREYREGKCNFEDYMNTTSVTNMIQLKVLSQMVFECLEKLNGLEEHLSQFDSSNNT